MEVEYLAAVEDVQQHKVGENAEILQALLVFLENLHRSASTGGGRLDRHASGRCSYTRQLFPKRNGQWCRLKVRSACESGSLRSDRFRTLCFRWHPSVEKHSKKQDNYEKHTNIPYDSDVAKSHITGNNTTQSRQRENSAQHHGSPY